MSSKSYPAYSLLVLLTSTACESTSSPATQEEMPSRTSEPDAAPKPDASTSSGAPVLDNPDAADGVDGGAQLPSDPDASSQPVADAGAAQPKRFVLGTVTIDADGNRMSYAQIVDELSGHFSTKNGIETGGNATFLSRGKNFFYGLAEAPEWVRYSTQDGFEETGRLSFLDFGITYMDYSNVVVDDATAVSVLTEQYVAVIWNPKTMEIVDTVDLAYLYEDGYSLEAWTVVAHDGLVYIPGKWVNWSAPTVKQKVSISVLDPKKKKILGVAEDERCGAGGRVTFDAKGYAYVMGDGRNQSMQVFAKANGEPTVDNCLLRIPPGETEFEADFFYRIPDLTGGLDSMTELEAADVGGGIGFTMMMYRDRIPEGTDEVNFAHWSLPAYKMWRIVLGDEPRAEVVKGADFSVVGFSGSGVNGKYYSAQSEDGSESAVYELDPQENTSTLKFTMDGYYSGLYPIE